jgi:hypothetical protein
MIHDITKRRIKEIDLNLTGKQITGYKFYAWDGKIQRTIEIIFVGEVEIKEVRQTKNTFVNLRRFNDIKINNKNKVIL